MEPIRPASPRGSPLRLIRPETGLSLRQADARRAVETENRAAALLTSGDRAVEDLRQIFALRAASTLEGGRAAILRPERRRELVAGAAALGMRPFEANLIIAVVQDGVRRGTGPLSPETRGLLRVIPAPTPSALLGSSWLRPGLAALLLGGMITLLLIDWLTRG
ncbi:MAG: hypothetical protein SFZ24_08590 [Planctomycetota bacterium]|nr:hypothetical protein [Planctomycetota bacterium]